MTTIVAFSCTHLCSPQTQLDLQEHNYKYSNARHMLDVWVRYPPDYVVNLGDFVEPMYDDDLTIEALIETEIPDYLKLKQVTEVIELDGNHDRGYNSRSFVDLHGIRFEHGHQLVPFSSGNFVSKDKYIEKIREATNGVDRLVHGHTHDPQKGPPLDVGSLTFSNTYGLISIDNDEVSYQVVPARICGSCPD